MKIELPRCFYARGHLREAEPDRLMIDQCLPEALADAGYVRGYVEEVLASRRRLQTEFNSLGISFWPSQANFVLARIGPLHAEFVAAMKARGILVRDRSSDWGCCRSR